MASTAKPRTGHLERTADEPRDKDLHEVRLSRIDQVNERVRLFRLDLTSGPVNFSPGQWLDTYIPGVSKAGGFTITSAPSAAAARSSSSSSSSSTPYLELAVQESPENEPAAWLWRPVDEILGSTLRVRVGGKFVFPPSSETNDIATTTTATAAETAAEAGVVVKKVVFVAGGVGVNPLMSMLSFIAERGGDDGVPDVRFLYASKLPQSGHLADIVFLDRITRLFGEGRVRGEVKLYVTTAAGNTATVSQETRHINGARVEVRPRRLTLADVEAAIGSEDHEGTVVYVCGPPTMTDELVEKLAAVIDPRRVLTERWW